MIGGSTFSEVFGSVPAGNANRLAQIARAAVRAGLAVVLCRTADKAPMCVLTAAQRKAADREAVKLATERGERAPERRRHACGLAHAFTDADAVFRVINRMVKSGLVPNLGVELGRSRMVVVDVDSADELKAFNDMRDTHEGARPRSLTVKSPGKISRDGETWAHRDGGHFWFTVPEGMVFPRGAGTHKVPAVPGGAAGWVVSWAEHQVLVPPSRRAEGVYELISEPEPLPTWLAKVITDVAVARDQRLKDRATMVIDSDDPIEQWSLTTPWAELLEPDGWLDTGIVDNCGCPIWTAPGVHAHHKSATAHDLGCAVFDTTTGWGPLRVWTDNPELDGIEGGRTYSKLQYVAARDHEGVARSAMLALGLASGQLMAPDVSYDAPLGNDSLSVELATAEGHPEENDPFVSAGSVASETESEDPVGDLLATWLSSEELDSIPEPEPLIEGVFDLDSVTRVIGKSGHGKSFVMIDMACSIALGKPWQGRATKQGLVVYMVAEGARGFKKRIRAWEHRHNGGAAIPKDALLVIPYPVQATDAKAWRLLRAALHRINPAMVVLDTQARITVGANENDASEMGVFVERVEQIRRETGACAVLVHHLGHQGEHGRGSSALIGALSTEVRVTKLGREVVVQCDKQKDEEAFEPIKLVMVPELASVVLVGSDDDPFDNADAAPAADSPLVDHIPYILWKHAPITGLTATAARVIAGEVRGKTPAKSSWSEAWNKAIKAGTIAAIAGPSGNPTKAFVVADGVAEQMGWHRR